MKKLLAFILFASSPALAGRMDEIVIMTSESIEATLGLNQSGLNYEITYQDFIKAAPGRDLAVLSKVLVTNSYNQENQEWTCVTQFVKTPKFFEVSETECK